MALDEEVAPHQLHEWLGRMPLPQDDHTGHGRILGAALAVGGAERADAVHQAYEREGFAFGPEVKAIANEFAEDVRGLAAEGRNALASEASATAAAVRPVACLLSPETDGAELRDALEAHPDSLELPALRSKLLRIAARVDDPAKTRVVHDAARAAARPVHAIESWNARWEAAIHGPPRSVDVVLCPAPVPEAAPAHGEHAGMPVERPAPVRGVRRDREAGLDR